MWLNSLIIYTVLRNLHHFYGPGFLLRLVGQERDLVPDYSQSQEKTKGASPIRQCFSDRAGQRLLRTPSARSSQPQRPGHHQVPSEDLSSYAAHSQGRGSVLLLTVLILHGTEVQKQSSHCCVR